MRSDVIIAWFGGLAFSQAAFPLGPVANSIDTCLPPHRTFLTRPPTCLDFTFHLDSLAAFSSVIANPIFNGHSAPSMAFVPLWRFCVCANIVINYHKSRHLDGRSLKCLSN